MENLIKKNQPVILIEFSYPCLERAGSKPNIFGEYIMDSLNYTFISILNNKLKIMKDSSPKDGYYFLIPNNKLESYHTIIEA